MAIRRHRGSAGGTTFASRGNAPPLPDNLSVFRTFNSESNPSRPMRPSPLAASTVHGMPLDMLDRIRTFPLFQSAPESFLAAIGKHLRPQVHAPRDYILTEGDDAKAMYWLVRGAVAVTSRDGESTYAELQPGAFFGEIGILMEIPRTATIIARTKCMLVVLKKEDLVKELPRFPEVERTIRDEAQERLSILRRKKKEKTASASSTSPPSTASRGGKRARDGGDGDIVMADSHSGSHTNGAQLSKKRKSPSPGLIEAAGSSALGHGLVNVRQLLRELPLFADLPPDILHFLGLSAQPCNYPPFTEIIKQDSHGREVYFIVRGEVEVIDQKATDQNPSQLRNGTRRHNGQHQPQVKARLRQGQYFGEVVSLSLAPRRTATVRSVTSVECLMIGGDVLSVFWERLPPTVRKQVEKTAKQRLQSKPEEDVEMTDVTDTPPIGKLAIGDRPTKSTRKKSAPKVTFTQPTYSKPASPHKPNRIDDRSIIQPADPDPFFNFDLDNIRSRSRRSSLAPPPPDGANISGIESQDRKISSTGLRASNAVPSFSKQDSTPSDVESKPKRPKSYHQKLDKSTTSQLPDSILVSIFSHLDLLPLMRLRLVSPHWSRLLRESPSLLKHLNLSAYNRKITDTALTNSICPFVGSRPLTIDISNCFHITDEGFATLAATCGANVTTWKMKSVWDITAQAVLEMANRAKHLEEVDLSNCRKVSDNLLARVVGWVVQGSPPNTAQHGRAAAARSVGAPVPPPQAAPGTVYGCPKLKKLTLSYCKHVTDRSMAHMAYHAAGRLEQVDLTRCTSITDQGFQHWGQFRFERLTKLCLADCTYLTDNAIIYLANAAKGLKDLDLVSNLFPSILSSPCAFPPLDHNLASTLPNYLKHNTTPSLIPPCPPPPLPKPNPPLTPRPPSTVLLLRPLRHLHRSPLPRLPRPHAPQPLLLRLRRLRPVPALHRPSPSRSPILIRERLRPRHGPGRREHC